MKIVGIEFKNINSFAGKWEVQFDRPPLSDTGLFAIVGPNGSGKSSILDAVTLGLYGETPRHRNPEERIIPWQADESYAAVTFSVGELRYRSEWRVKCRSGGLEGPEMRLLQLNGGESLLEDRIIRVRSRVAELTGLDFKRFCRSILLAQGEFAAFLAALESERSDILEKIIGPEMMLELERSIRSRVTEEAEKLQQLKEAAASIRFLDQARLSQVEQEEEQLLGEISAVERTLSELREQENWLRQLEQAADAERSAAQALAEAKARQAELNDQLDLLEAAEPARPLAGDMERLDHLGYELEDADTQLERLSEAIPARETRLAELRQQLEASLVELEKARAQLEERGEEWDGAALEDREIEAKGQRFLDAVRDLEEKDRRRRQGIARQAELDVELAGLNKELQSLQQRLEQMPGDEGLFMELPAIESALKRLMDLQQRIRDEQGPRAELLKVERAAARELEKHEQNVRRHQDKAGRTAQRRTDGMQRLRDLLENKGPEHWAKIIKASREKLSLCRELAKIGNQYREQQINGDALERLQRVESQIETVRASLAEEKAHLEQLAGDIRWRDRVRGLDAERAGLEEGEACPLCGSLDHPYALRGAPNFTELDHTVQAAEHKIAALRHQLDSLEATAAGLQVRANEMSRLRQLWTKTCEKGGFEWAVPDARLAQTEIRAQKAVIKDGKSRIRSARWQRWKNGWLERSLLRKEARLSRREAVRDEVRRRYELQQQALAAVDGKIAGLQEEDQMIRSGLDARLSNYRERASAPGAEASLLARLHSRVENYRLLHDEHKTKQARLQSLENEKLLLSDELQQLQQDIPALTEEIEGLQTALTRLKADREGRYGSMDPLGERGAVESIIAGCNKEQAELQEEIESLQKQQEADQASFTHLSERKELLQQEVLEIQPGIEERAAAAGFSSLDQVREALTLLRDEGAVRDQHHLGRLALAQAESQEAAARDVYARVRGERKSEDSLTAIGERLADHEKQRDTLLERKSDVDRLLAEQRAAEREYREIQRAIAEQEKVWAHAAAEEGMLESPDGPEIRARLQRLMLDRLLEHANQHLTSISGRYRLLAEEQNGFGFVVRDAQQARTHRSAKTLSGGETFVVSLCLALGLSEMACQHRKIESLFIDEGFGALDDENLYRVMTVLKGLRENGKTVGIISHVKRLANEIPTQIRVEKQVSGMSRLTITA